MAEEQKSASVADVGSQISSPSSPFDLSQVLGVRLVSIVSSHSAEADVWLGESDDGARVAVKIYRHGQLPGLMDVQKKRDLVHRHLVPIIDGGEVQGRYYEVSPYMVGPTLEQFVAQKKTFSEGEGIRLLGQLAEVIHYLHAQHVLHRDIKPSNIFITGLQPLEVALADFGSARFTANQTMLTGSLGTVAYSAPEAVTGLQSEASDYWSLGIVLLEAMTGRQPFQGIDLRQQLYRVASGQVEVPEGLPERWQALFRGLLTTDYTQRWRKKEIDQWLKGERAAEPRMASAAPPTSGRLARRRQRKQVKLERFSEAETLTSEDFFRLFRRGAYRALVVYFWIAFIVHGVTGSSFLAFVALLSTAVIAVALMFLPGGFERLKREKRVERELRSLSRRERRRIRKLVRRWLREERRR